MSSITRGYPHWMGQRQRCGVQILLKWGFRSPLQDYEVGPAVKQKPAQPGYLEWTGRQRLHALFSLTMGTLARLSQGSR
jgi:hypothetical protein